MKDPKGHGSNPRGGSISNDFPPIGQGFSAAYKAAHQQGVEAAAPTRYQSFLAGLTPMQAAKARDALEMQVRYNGQEFLPRHEMIGRKIDAGAQIENHPKFGRILRGADGAFLDTRNATKTGLDYAEFLHQKRQG